MDNVWVSETDGDDKIIAIDAEYVYKCSPRQPRLSSELIDPQFIEETKNYYRIPVSYIKKIVLKENKKYIQVFFGKDSEERLRILDPEKRKEIFDFLRQYFPDAKYSTYTPTLIDIGKKPGIAVLILVILYLWSLVYVAQIHTGGKILYSNSFLENLTIGLASLGLVKMTLIFLMALSIPCVSIFIKNRKKSPVHVLILKKTGEQNPS